ncbi:MAG: hypothetical protein D3914_13360 [Candidatus Electrothrix sp. LOE2]|nr:hypothetical protein [Candidatus Electrothrix sp. LOE2]
MDELVEILRYLKEHPEVTWSGAGLTVLAVLYFLITKLFAPLFRKDPVPPGGSTFMHSGTGDQNIAQGNRPIGKQENHQQEAKGDHNVFSQSGDVCYEEHHHYHDRTEQGIPL